MQDGKPFLVFSVQVGDTQDQNLLQFFLNVVEFGMTPQEATEAANITSYQMCDSFGSHESRPGTESPGSGPVARASEIITCRRLVMLIAPRPPPCH